MLNHHDRLPLRLVLLRSSSLDLYLAQKPQIQTHGFCQNPRVSKRWFRASEGESFSASPPASRSVIQPVSRPVNHEISSQHDNQPSGQPTRQPASQPTSRSASQSTSQPSTHMSEGSSRQGVARKYASLVCQANQPPASDRQTTELLNTLFWTRSGRITEFLLHRVVLRIKSRATAAASAHDQILSHRGSECSRCSTHTMQHGNTNGQ